MNRAAEPLLSTNPPETPLNTWPVGAPDPDPDDDGMMTFPAGGLMGILPPAPL